MSSPNDIRKGTVIRFEGDLWFVVGFQRVSPGKGSSFVRTRMKNLKTNKLVEHVFKSAESLDFEDVAYRKMQYLFGDDQFYTFMDTQNYEQVQIAADQVGEDARFLKDGLEVTVVMHGEMPITIELPKKIQYTIVTAPPAVKGDTASGNISKEVVLDNGLKIQAPIFVKEGEVVLVNTDTGDYSERVNE